MRGPEAAAQAQTPEAGRPAERGAMVGKNGNLEKLRVYF